MRRLAQTIVLLLCSLALVASTASAGLAQDGETAETGPSAPETPGSPATPTIDVDAIDAAERRQVELLLSGYEYFPTREDLEEAVPEPRTILIAIATDEMAFPFHRDRALGALAYWPDSGVRALYESMLAADETPEMRKHRLIGYLVHAFGDSALPVVTPYLSHDDVQFRLTAVHALGEIDSDAARAALVEAGQGEENRIVLERIDEATREVR